MEAFKVQAFFRPFLEPVRFLAEYIHSQTLALMNWKCQLPIGASDGLFLKQWKQLSREHLCGAAKVPFVIKLKPWQETIHSLPLNQEARSFKQSSAPAAKHNIHTKPTTPPLNINSLKAAQRFPQAHQENQWGLFVDVGYGSLRSTANFSQGKPIAI